MPASPIRRLAPYAVAARQRGVEVLGLNIGQPDIATPKVILDKFGEYEASYVPYGPSQGLPMLIEALRVYYGTVGVTLAQDDLFVTTAGSEAIQFTLSALCDPGDQVIVFEPFYTNYNGFAAMAGVECVPVTTHGADGYHLPDRATIEARIGPRTKAMLICSPNNPTGTVYTDAELEMLASICSERGLFLVSDEVYREFTYDGKKSRSALTLAGLEQRVVVVDSVSKRYSLCGARIGNIVCRNRAFMDAILRFGQARLCPPTIEQFACSALTNVPTSYTKAVLTEYQKRRDSVFASLSEIPDVRVRKPEGAFYVCTGLPVEDANDFAIFLLQDFSLKNETVMVAPLDGFYVTPGLGRDEVRLAYVLEVPKLERAMRILGEALTAYRAKTTA